MEQFNSIVEWADAFLFDRRVQGFTAGTVANYERRLRRFRLVLRLQEREHR